MTSKTTTAGSDADRQAVLDVLARVYRAWEAGDAEAFVADYTEDASVIQPGVYAVASERMVRATWLLVGRDGGWRIASYHNSPAS